MNWDLVITVAGTLGGVALGYLLQAKTIKADRQAAYKQQHRDTTTQLLGELDVAIIRELQKKLDWTQFLFGESAGFIGTTNYFLDDTTSSETKDLLIRLASASNGHPSTQVRETLDKLHESLTIAIEHGHQALAEHMLMDRASEYNLKHRTTAEKALEDADALRQRLAATLQEDT